MKKILTLFFIISALCITASAAEGDYIIKYRKDAPVFMAFSNSGSSLGADMHLVSKEQALALQESGFLEMCEADTEMTYYGTTPDDTYYAQQWNLSKISAEYAWSLETFGNDVLVGVIDSGLAPNHPDIDYSRVEEGYNFGAFTSDEDYATNRLDTSDEIGHGTMVCGTIIAKRNNALGVCGIADKVKLLPLKAASKTGSIYVSSVVSAINAGAGYGCDVINLSLGMGSGSTSLETAINNALSLGCIVIAAAGNDNTSDPGDHIRYPAGYEGVISVGSTTRNNTRAESSVTNQSIFVCAPADNIPLINRTGGYSTANGTSFAAPQVAAAAAIAKCINPDLTPSEFATILAITAFKPSEDDADNLLTNNSRDTELGYGILNIETMIKYMLDGRSFYVSPYDTDSATVSIFNLTDSPVYATSIFGAYSNNGLADYDYKPVPLDANGSCTHTFDSKASYNKLRHFLWKSLESATPSENDYIPRELIVPAE